MPLPFAAEVLTRPSLFQPPTQNLRTTPVPAASLHGNGGLTGQELTK